MLLVVLPPKIIPYDITARTYEKYNNRKTFFDSIALIIRTA